MPHSIDLLLTNATIVTMNQQKDIHYYGAIAVNNDTIVDIGDTKNISAKYNAKKTINCQGCVVSPGMVNAHTHVPMTLMRGLSDDLRLDVWLYGFMMPVEREFVNPEFSYVGTRLACAEMIRGGITSFCDMYYYEDQVAQATADSGLRAICGQTILKFPAPDAGNYDDSLNYCKTFIQKWKGHPLIVPAVAPHAPYTATPEMLQACVDLAVEYDVPLHIHIGETTQEQENSKADYDMHVVPWLEKYNVFNAKVVAAHCVHLDDTELDTLKESNAGVAHCPSSNLKLSSGVAPIHKMVQMGLNVGIGTDGTASNNDLDMIEETRLAAFLQKGIYGDPTMLPAAKAWELATIGGAKAIHMDALTGSLEPGKKADLIVIDMSASHQTPRFSHSADTIYSQLVYAAKSTDVRDVIVNGQILMENRALLTVNESEVHQQAVTIAEKMDTFLATRENDLVSKLLAVGSGVTPVETFEVQGKVTIDTIEEIETGLNQPAITVTSSSIRNQYDVYFLFEQQDLGRIRHREDEVLNADGSLKEVLYRINLMGPVVEKIFDNSVILTRSRYSFAADKSRRFYKEYFQPSREIQVEKHRRRYHIIYKNTHFAVNLDTLLNNNQSYLEIKSGTWSAKDAQEKAELIAELLDLLNVNTDENRVNKEYLYIV